MSETSLKEMAFRILARSQLCHCAAIIHEWQPSTGTIEERQRKLKELDIIRQHVDTVLFDLEFKLKGMIELLEKEVAKNMAEIVNGK